MIRFGIDLDGVMFNFDEKIINIANKLYPGRLPVGYEPSDWNFDGRFKASEWDEIWTIIKRTPDFWATENPYVENVRALHDFINGRFPQVYYITSRVETTGTSVLEQSFVSLNAYNLMNSNTSVIAVSSSTKKKAVIEALELPYFLDDYDRTVADLQSLPNTRTFVLDRSWNRRAVELPRVFSVREYLNIVVKNS